MDKAALARQKAIDHFSRGRSFRLGSVDVFPESGTISGPGGSQQLDPKVMEVLMRLAAAPGEVVTREALMMAVWPGSVVTDFALSRCIYQLRKNLRRIAETSDSPIETLPKRGYRLVWGVSGTNAAVAGPVKVSRLGLGLLAAAILAVVGVFAWWLRTPPHAPASERVAIAVLPFVDLTRAKDLGYFGNGVAVSLMTELEHITEIDVIAQTSSFKFGEEDADINQIAKALDVGYVVEGSVNSENDTVQVTATLVDATSARQVWAGTFAGTAGQSFTAQRGIAEAIAGYLEISLGDPRSHGGTTVFEAWDAYFKATEAVNTVRDDGTGDVFLDQALAWDPDFARALEAKAFYIYLRLWQGDGVVEDAWNEARPYLERALELNDQSSFAYGTLAGFQILREDYESAEANLRRALKLNPSDNWALMHLSRLMERTGRLEEAVKLARHNARLDPLNSFRHIQLANRLWSAGEYESAKASFERSIELDPLNYSGWRDYCQRLANRDGVLAGFRLLARLQENPRFRAQFTGPEPQLAPTGIGLIAAWFGLIEDNDRKIEMLELQSRMGDSAGLHRELGWAYLARGETGRAREEAWQALRGIPRNVSANLEVASIALRTGRGIEAVRDHYRSFWPGLFETPTSIADAPDPVVMSAALVAREIGEEPQASALLDALANRDSASGSFRAMALAHSGETAAALEALEAHVEGGGFFSYVPGDPFWEPLAGEPRFIAIVKIAEAGKAQMRAELDAMLDRGELILPGHLDE